MEIEMRTLLPKFLTHDRNGFAICKGIEKGMQMYTDSVEAGRKIIGDIDSMPEWRLDEMAWELNCIYDYSLPIDDKRKLINNAIGYSRRAGTYRDLMNVITILNNSLEAKVYADATYIRSGSHLACIVNVYVASDDDEVKSRVFASVKKNVESIIPLDCGIQLAVLETDLSEKWSRRYDLTAFDLTPWSAVTLTGIRNAFYACGNMQTIDVEGLKTGSITDFSNLFQECYSLKEIDISSWDTSNAVNMQNMFSTCSDAETISMSGNDVSKVTNFYGLCSGNHSMKTFREPSGKSSATSLFRIFMFCRSVETLKLGGICPSETESCNVQEAFRLCNNMKTLDVSQWKWTKLISMKTMFQQCSNLTTIVFAEDPGTISPQEIDLTDVKFDQATMETFCGMLETCTDGSGILDVWTWNWGSDLRAAVAGKGWTVTESNPS